MTETKPEGLIILDLDGVILLKTPEGFQRIYNETLSIMGVELPDHILDEVLATHWGSPPTSIVRECIEKWREISVDLGENTTYEDQSSMELDHPYDRPDEGVEKLIKAATELFEVLYMEDYPEIVRPARGISESFNRLRGRYALALNTGSDSGVLFKKLLPKLNGGPELFNGGIRVADNLPKNELPKPHPSTVLNLMQENGMEPDNTIVVGDDLTDVISAYQAGVRPVVVSTGNIRPEQEAEIASTYGVEHFINNVMEVEALAPKLITPRTVGRTALSGSAV